MRMMTVLPLLATVTTRLVGCASVPKRDLAHDPFLASQEDIRQLQELVFDDCKTAAVDALRAHHLESDKFTKFGGKRFDRMNIAECNKQEARDVTLLSTLEDVEMDWRDPKIDVFGDVAIATFYFHVEATKNGQDISVESRVTEVLLKTDDGWKIIREHVTPKSCFEQGAVE